MQKSQLQMTFVGNEVWSMWLLSSSSFCMQNNLFWYSLQWSYTTKIMGYWKKCHVKMSKHKYDIQTTDIINDINREFGVNMSQEIIKCIHNLASTRRNDNISRACLQFMKLDGFDYNFKIGSECNFLKGALNAILRNELNLIFKRVWHIFSILT